MSWFSRIFAEPESPQHQGEAIPSDLTVGQLLDAIGSGGGGVDLFDNYSVGLGGLRDIRNASLAFPTYFRVISLCSGVIAQLLSGGSLRIRGRDGELVKTDKARRILDLFEHSPDGVTPAHNWIEDWAIDLLVEGNALCEVVKGYRGAVIGLKRLSVWDANTVAASDGTTVYRAREIGARYTNDFQEIAEMNVMHSRWGRAARHSASQSANRWNFAPAPVRLMRTSLEVGLAGDKAIMEWFQGQKANVGIAFKGRLTPEQYKQVQSQIVASTDRRRPLLVGADATFTNLQNNAADKDQAALREFQVSDVARIYGVPGPIVGQAVTQWGQGIETLSKLFWKFGVRQHMNRLMAAAKKSLLQPGQRFEVDPTELLRGDIADIATLITAVSGDAQRDQVATTEEMRNWMGLPGSPESGELRKAPENGSMGMNDTGMTSDEG